MIKQKKNLSYKRIASQTLLITTLSLASLTVTSCNKSVDYDLQKINSVSAHIFTFGLQAKDNEGLSKYVFSIDNSKAIGNITNVKPLPYGIQLKDVSIPISVAPQSKVIIEGITAQAIEWKKEDKYQLPTNKVITLTVTNTENEAYNYTYKLLIKQYTYEPETISWSKHAISPNENLLLNQGYTFQHPENGKWYLYVKNTPNVYELFPQTAPQLVEFTGLSAGESIKRIISDHTSVYALTQKGQVYQLRNMQWIALNGANNVYDLLGILPSFREGKTNSLVLLISSQESIAQGSKTRLQFGVYNGKHITISNQPVPNDFPGRRDSDISFAINKTAEYEGTSILLSAVTSSDLPNKSYRTSWFTSDGLSWGRRQTELLDVPQPISTNFIHIKDTYYRLETLSTGLTIYHSKDLINWMKSKDVAFTGLDQNKIKDQRCISWNENGKIILIGDQSSIWQGELLDEKISQ